MQQNVAGSASTVQLRSPCTVPASSLLPPQPFRIQPRSIGGGPAQSSPHGLGCTKRHVLAQPKWAPRMLGNHRDVEATSDPLWYSLALSLLLPKQPGN